MTTKLSHGMSISGGIDYYLIQIKLGHAGDMGDEDLLSHVTSIEFLFDSNKDTGEMTRRGCPRDSQSLSVAESVADN